MALVQQQEAQWYVNTADRDMRALDALALPGGMIGVAFGGATSGGSGVIYSGLVNLASGTLGAIRENLLAGNSSAGVPVTTVRDIELDAGRPGRMVATFHMANSAVGADGNFALLTQVYAGATAQGSPHAVNPGGAAQNTSDVFSTITRANGSYLTFSTEMGGGTNLSNGIQMTAFNANGTMLGTPHTVVVDRLAIPAFNIEANPEAPAAAFMANGNIGLAFEVFTPAGQWSVAFQQITPAGALVGPEVALQDAAALGPHLVALTNGKMLAVWQSIDGFAASTLRAQVIGANGTPLGAAFDVASAHAGSESPGDVVALANGGFAVSWSNGNHPLGRIFTADGHALGNDFSLTETSASYDVIENYGLTVSGSRLVGFVAAANAGQPDVLLGEVFGTGSTLGVTRGGSSLGEASNGTARDDNLSGLGGNDQLNGLGGNDILDGGAQADRINGGAGRDVLHGGAGADTVTGGTGADVFIFNAPDEARDVIRDFSQAEGDRIGVDNIGFGHDFGPGFFLPLLSTWVTNGPTTNADAAGFFFNTTTHVLSFDVDGAGAVARFDLAVLTGITSLSASDLYII